MFRSFEWQCIVLIMMCLLSTVLSKKMQHQCKGTKTEAGGPSGTIEFAGDCSLTLTNVSGTLSIPGITSDSSCDRSMQLNINKGTYCVDRSVKDTLIKTTTKDQLEFSSVGASSFILNYYKGGL